MLTEIDVLGVYVSPYAMILLVVWGAMFALRIILTRFGVFRHAWHPALLMFSAFVSVFSLAVLLAVAVS